MGRVCAAEGRCFGRFKYLSDYAQNDNPTTRSVVETEMICAVFQCTRGLRTNSKTYATIVYRIKAQQ